MKRSFIAGLLLALSASGFVSLAYAEQIMSLRGVNELDAPSNRVVVKRNISDRDPIERDYVQQPPLIPHKIKGYRINLKFNKCLTCHSWRNYKDADATKISQTHFADRDNNVMANIAARRYFCTQCHVPQVEAKPLVENYFTPVRAIHK